MITFRARIGAATAVAAIAAAIPTGAAAANYHFQYETALREVAYEIAASIVTAATPNKERRVSIAKLREGKLNFVCQGLSELLEQGVRGELLRLRKGLGLTFDLIDDPSKADVVVHGSWDRAGKGVLAVAFGVGDRGVAGVREAGRISHSFHEFSLPDKAHECLHGYEKIEDSIMVQRAIRVHSAPSWNAPVAAIVRAGGTLKVAARVKGTAWVVARIEDEELPVGSRTSWGFAYQVIGGDISFSARTGDLGSARDAERHRAKEKETLLAQIGEMEKEVEQREAASQSVNRALSDARAAVTKATDDQRAAAEERIKAKNDDQRRIAEQRAELASQQLELATRTAREAQERFDREEGPLNARRKLLDGARTDLKRLTDDINRTVARINQLSDSLRKEHFARIRSEVERPRPVVAIGKAACQRELSLAKCSEEALRDAEQIARRRGQELLVAGLLHDPYLDLGGIKWDDRVSAVVDGREVEYQHLDAETMTERVRLVVMIRGQLSPATTESVLRAIDVTAPPQSAALEPTVCDRLAAHPYDPRRVVLGVAFDAIVADRAVEACLTALRAHPDTPRFLFQLGRALEKAGSKSAAEAIATYQKAAEANYAPAQYNLATLLTKGWGGVTPDPGKAMLWLRRAAEENYYAPALSALGDAYFSGNGVKQDKDRAKQLYTLAAEKGDADAERMLRIMK